MTRRRAPRRNRALLIAALMATTALVGLRAEAQQTGLNVTAGSATMTSPKAGQTVIRQTTEKAILNWQNFSIASGSSVTFQQPEFQRDRLEPCSGFVRVAHQRQPDRERPGLAHQPQRRPVRCRQLG